MTQDAHLPPELQQAFLRYKFEIERMEALNGFIKYNHGRNSDLGTDTDSESSSGDGSYEHSDNDSSHEDTARLKQRFDNASFLVTKLGQLYEQITEPKRRSRIPFYPSRHDALTRNEFLRGIEELRLMIDSLYQIWSLSQHKQHCENFENLLLSTEKLKKELKAQIQAASKVPQENKGKIPAITQEKQRSNQSSRSLEADIPELYLVSTEGLRLISRILDSHEVLVLADKLHRWGADLFQGPLGLSRLYDLQAMHDTDLTFSFVLNCLWRICVNIDLLLSNLNFVDEHTNFYQTQLANLLKESASPQVALMKGLLAQVEPENALSFEQQMLASFDSVEADVDVLFRMLPAIDTIRHITSYEIQTNTNSSIGSRSRRSTANKISQENEESITAKKDGQVDVVTLYKLANENLHLATAIIKSLQDAPLIGTKSPENTLAKLFEDERETLKSWRDMKKEQGTRQMKDILIAQRKLLKDSLASPTEKIVEDGSNLLRDFQEKNHTLQELVHKTDLQIF